MKPVLTKINNYGELLNIIRSAGAWFVGAFIIEIIDNYEKTRDRKKKREFIEYFHERYCETMDGKQLRDRINCLIRIVESNMIVDALKYVTDTANPEKIGCKEAVENAQILLNKVKNGEVILPVFE
jgi:hypothetical protein